MRIMSAFVSGDITVKIPKSVPEYQVERLLEKWDTDGWFGWDTTESDYRIIAAQFCGDELNSDFDEVLERILIHLCEECGAVVEGYVIEEADYGKFRIEYDATTGEMDREDIDWLLQCPNSMNRKLQQEWRKFCAKDKNELA